MANDYRRTSSLSLLLAVFMTALLLSACNTSSVPETKEDVPRITVENVKEQMDNGESIVLGDTRSVSEFGRRHIAGSVSIPSGSAAAAAVGIPLDQEIILYCT